MCDDHDTRRFDFLQESRGRDTEGRDETGVDRARMLPPRLRRLVDVRARVTVSATALSVESAVPRSVVPLAGHSMSAWNVTVQGAA